MLIEQHDNVIHQMNRKDNWKLVKEIKLVIFKYDLGT